MGYHVQDHPALDENSVFYESEIKPIGSGCIRCGSCCSVAVNDGDNKRLSILRIDEIMIRLDTGLKRDEFLVEHYSKPHKTLRTKQNHLDGKNYCIFFNMNDESEGSCNIYRFRPITCRLYPYGSQCDSGAIKKNIIKRYFDTALFILLSATDVFVP